MVVQKAKKSSCKAYNTTWSMMLSANFPTLVPPNFCTTQLLLALTGLPLAMDRGSESDKSWFSMLVNFEIEGWEACNQV